MTVKRRAYCPPFRPMWKILEPAQVGPWKIERFYLSKAAVEFAQIRATINGRWPDVRDLQPSHYVRLVHDGAGVVTMSDTPMERRTNLEFVRRARGRVVVGGLGLGMIVVPAVAKPEVTELVVIEKNPEVAELVAPQLARYLGPSWAKVNVVIGDVFDDGAVDGVFDVVYHDIWNYPDAEAHHQIVALRRTWRPRLAVDGWFGAWRADDARDAARAGSIR